ncbi:MAG: hypothetical protein KatS3mg131_3181 [Candidatus Tectimicrobiota bacterium]|nr:MAG: hypothetical protein KatS3mg131_3181 [Candidatus Tectomicrobia bacterium]
MAAPFSCQLRVQFYHTDAQGRVFYAHFFAFLEQARCAFWEALGFDEATVRQIEQETVVVHLEADYLGPAAFYDLLRVEVSVEALGKSSLRLGYRIAQARSGEEIFRARTVLVQIDPTTARARPWSEAFRQAILAHCSPQGGQA